MADTRKKQQKNVQHQAQSHTQKFRTAESETAEQDQPTRADPNAKSTNLGQSLDEKEREDYRHSGIPIGSDPRE